MRATDLRLWFIGLTIVLFIGTSYQNAQWERADYDPLARVYASEIAHINAVSDRAPSPRIVFAGGSSVIYAIDAKLIERELGIPVINMGISSRLGSDTNYLDYLLPHLRRGDLVIFSNHSWWARLTPSADALETREARRLAERLWHLDRIDLSERHNVDWPWLLPIPNVAPINRLLARNTPATEISVRQRDDRGSLVQCAVRPASIKPHDVSSAAMDRALIDHSRKVVRDVESRGASIIFFETRILIAEREREKWSRHREQMRAQLGRVAPFLDAPDASIFSADPGRFCDSASHVDDDIRVEWSRSLSLELRQLPAVRALVASVSKAAPKQGVR